MATTTTSSSGVVDYCGLCLPAVVTEKLQAGAFRLLCQHLRERSDAVPNMDLMTISGFCRNCLAKVLLLLHCIVLCCFLLYTY